MIKEKPIEVVSPGAVHKEDALKKITNYFNTSMSCLLKFLFYLSGQHFTAIFCLPTLNL